jgi:tryptophan synthase alpha chain
MPEGRIASTFAALRAKGVPGLIAYVTAGDPSPGRTVDLVLALAQGGAEFIELGVPFSDPIADGPVIQRASERALRAGTTLGSVLDIASAVRRRSAVPLILFSYMNPLVRYGFERLAHDAAERGIDGCLLTDLSVEEAAAPAAHLRKAGLDTIFLAAPTSTARRLRLVAEYSSGFVYVVSRAGITGERESVAAAVRPLVESLRRFTALPLAVGFGVSRPEHFAEVAGYADGVVVGSAIVRIVEQHGTDPDLPEQLELFARSLRAAAITPVR